MFARLKNSLVFRLEQFMMRSPMARFGIILLLVVVVSPAAGALVRPLTPGFESTADAIWWAFLRLTDPGYLGDDEGAAKASISTVITVLGSILFMGALIAILVQWLGESMERLERGLTPVVLDAHFVLLGWTSRTPTILEEIMVSQGRVERFLRRRGARRLYVAVLAELADASLVQDLRLQLGEHWNARQIVLRSGSTLRLDDLERVDFAHAGAIIVHAADTTAASAMLCGNPHGKDIDDPGRRPKRSSSISCLRSLLVLARDVSLSRPYRPSGSRSHIWSLITRYLPSSTKRSRPATTTLSC